MSQPAIRIVDLWKFYNEDGHESSAALRGASLTVGRGEILALMGKSGSGKSTLLNLVAGLDRPSRGLIEIDGQNLDSLGEAGRTELRRKHLGFVFQFFNLIPTLTALENVYLPLELAGKPDPAVARSALAEVGLDGKEGRYPQELSGGEQQRAAIARALAMRPKAMLFDEPTASLDPEAVGEVLSVIRELVAQEGMTTLIATHEMGFAREVADRIVVFDNGEIIESGPPEEIFTSPKNERARTFLGRILNRT